MVKIILEDGKTLELNTPIQKIINALDWAIDGESEFISIEIEGARRLIRTSAIKEVIEIEEFSPSVSNFNVTINIDTDEFIEKLTKTMMERLNQASQGCAKPN